MANDVEKIIADAASNVACESSEPVSKATLEDIKNHLLTSKHSDESFIHSLYEAILGNENEESDGKRRGRK